jgi:hypothetical protein
LGITTPPQASPTPGLKSANPTLPFVATDLPPLGLAHITSYTIKVYESGLRIPGKAEANLISKGKDKRPMAPPPTQSICRGRTDSRPTPSRLTAFIFISKSIAPGRCYERLVLAGTSKQSLLRLLRPRLQALPQRSFSSSHHRRANSKQHNLTRDVPPSGFPEFEWILRHDTREQPPPKVACQGCRR